MGEDNEIMEVYEYTPIGDLAAFATRFDLPLVTLSYVPDGLTVADIAAFGPSASPRYRTSWFAMGVPRGDDGGPLLVDGVRSIEVVVARAESSDSQGNNAQELDSSLPYRVWMRRHEGSSSVVIIELGNRYRATLITTGLTDEDLTSVVNGLRAH